VTRPPARKESLVDRCRLLDSPEGRPDPEAWAEHLRTIEARSMIVTLQLLGRWPPRIHPGQRWYPPEVDSS
jgi:hypothetical protein